MVAQGVLPFQYEEEKSSTGMTALAGLPLYLALFAATGRALGKGLALLGIEPPERM